MVQQPAKRARGPYTKFTAEQRATIGKRAAEHGVAATVRYYEKQYPNGNVKDSSVRTWRNATSEIKKRRREGREDIQNFDELKTQFLLDIKVVVEMDEIPPALVINWDQTGIHYVPVASWTMDKEGSKRVEIVAVDDKQQITAVFAGSLAGDFLPPQLISKAPQNVVFHKSTFHLIGTSRIATTIGQMRTQ